MTSELTMPSGFDRIRRRALREEVLEPLRAAILFGKLPVGARLMEEQLAHQLGISRVPIREALRQLEHEGLVVSYPHRGTVVAAVDEDEVDLLYRLRADLEGFAVESVMCRGAAALVDQLQLLVEAMRSGAREGRLIELAEGDLEFHRAVVSSSGYHILKRLWQGMDGPIRARLHRVLSGPFRGELIEYTAESHQAVVDAIASGNPEHAVEAIRTHILETRNLVENGLKARRGSPATDGAEIPGSSGEDGSGGHPGGAVPDRQWRFQIDRAEP